VPEEAVTIIIREMAKTNYAKAGKLKCDEAAAAKPASK
jgi:phenylpyruvate tautomerase PptA (4-oxalocrotonate tautomerase family)